MQNFWVKQAVSVVVCKTKTVDVLLVVLHSTQQNIFSQHYYQSYCDYLLKMDKEQAVFEQLILSDYQKWNCTTLKTFNNYTIIMTNNSDKIIISWMWGFSFLSFFLSWIQQDTLVNFMLYLIIFKILKIWFWTFWRKNCIENCNWKLPKAFRIAQCKQSRLVKPWLNLDLSFIFKSSGTAILETICSSTSNTCVINKMVNWHIVDYHPSPSKLTSRVDPLTFLWTPKGFISPKYFLNFFSNVYITPWLQKSFMVSSFMFHIHGV